MRKSGSNPGKELLGQGDIQVIIAERAYYKAERDGFPLGNDHYYWLEAEREVVAELGFANGKQAPAKPEAASKKPSAEKPASKKA